MGEACPTYESKLPFPPKCWLRVDEAKEHERRTKAWVIPRLRPRPGTSKMCLSLGEISSMIGKRIILGRDKPLSPLIIYTM